jgi:hypothetical protein
MIWQKPNYLNEQKKKKRKKKAKEMGWKRDVLRKLAE